MWVRAVREFEYRDQRNNLQTVTPGQLVDVFHRDTLNSLMSRGMVVPKMFSWQTKQAEPVMVEPGRQRVLVWMPLSAHYSGGRIHITQCAWCLAKAGCEVTIAGEKEPPWLKDYPRLKNLRMMEHDPSVVPDFDLIIVDGKNDVARLGQKYAEIHGVPLVVWNFETPNWVAEFLPDVAKRIQYHDRYKDVFRTAALAVANSEESAKYLREWIGADEPSIAVLPPAINIFAIGDTAIPPELVGRRYVATSGRADSYKNNQVSLEAVWALDCQCDLVSVGHFTVSAPQPTELHRMTQLTGIPDNLKFSVFRGATAVLAPSDFEGFGMVPGEAMAVGTPCIVYDLPVLRQVYGDTLEYVPRGDSVAFGQRVKELVEAPYQTVPEDTVANVIQSYGMEAMQQRVEAMPHHHAAIPHISALMNAYACATIVPFVLEAVYPHVDEIIIAYGREAVWDWPADNTLEVLQGYPDPDGKIKIIAQEVWPGETGEQSRVAMRRAATALATGNHIMLLDADEIWTGFEHYVAALKDGAIQGGCPLSVTFWHNLKHHILSSALERWGLRSPSTDWGTVWPHVRLVPWRRSNRWHTHIVPYNIMGKQVWPPETNLHTVEALGDRCVLYHLGQAMPRAFMECKKRYYTERDVHRPSEVAWLSWDGEVGECGDGLVEEVTWSLPQIVKEAYGAIHQTRGLG